MGLCAGAGRWHGMIYIYNTTRWPKVYPANAFVYWRGRFLGRITYVISIDAIRVFK